MPNSESLAVAPPADADTRVQGGGAATESLATVAGRLILFLIPVLLAWLALEYWMTRVPSSHTVKRQNLDRLAATTDTLILGSSGAFWDISPEHLPGSAYNLGNVAQTLYYDDQLATQWLPRLPRLRRAIIVIPYVSMFFQLHGTDEEARQYYYYQVWGIPPPRWRERLDVRMWSDVALRTPLFAVSSLRTALAAHAKGEPLTGPPVDPPIDARGWCPRLPGDPADLTPRAVASKIAYHHGIMHLSDEPANLAALEHLVSMLRSHAVEVILVTPPVWPEYSARMKKEYWDLAQADFQRLSRKYGVRYLSFLRLPQFGAADFLDADHLNEHGAVRFTELLSAAIQGEHTGA